MALGNEQKAVIFERAAVRSIEYQWIQSMDEIVFNRLSMDVYLMELMNIYN